MIEGLETKSPLAIGLFELTTGDSLRANTSLNDCRVTETISHHIILVVVGCMNVPWFEKKRWKER